MNKITSSSLLWVLAFAAIFFLTQDYLFIQWSNTIGFLGFPKWLFWFIGIHLLLVFVLYIFIKRYWTTEDK